MNLTLAFKCFYHVCLALWVYLNCILDSNFQQNYFGAYTNFPSIKHFINFYDARIEIKMVPPAACFYR